MREQLVQYVNLLFAGAQGTADIRAEILQNTLDRYDDLVAQGKSPEAAYRLAISGIGDISEILGNIAYKGIPPVQTYLNNNAAKNEDDPKAKKYRAIAIAMYILCPIPLFVLSEFGASTLGLCLTIGLVAAATYVMVIYGKNERDNGGEKPQFEMEIPTQTSPKKSISKIIWTISLAVYFILSFATDAWSNTWLIFPIAACVEGLSNAILDLKEAKRHEK